MESRICLIRHGITEGNKNKLFYGHADIPLAEEGVAELKRLVETGLYPDGSKADFYTTGLRRTEQTLELIYGNQEHETLEGLKELNFGDFEMKSYSELKDLEEYKNWRADERGDLSPPNGESLKAFYKRIVRGFEDLKNRHALKVLSMRHKEEEALSIAVCHGGTISAIMESIYPRVKDNFYKWIPDPGHGYILFMKDGEVADVKKVLTGNQEDIMNIKQSVTELIGSTPLLRLNKMEKSLGACAEIIAKVEMFNPAGSIKDRVGCKMITEAEESGRLKPGGTIIEPTSGNTGVGIAMTAAARGYKCIMVMPENMSVERQKLLAALGAELVLTDKDKGMQGSLDKADELAEKMPGSIIAGQFVNPSNPQAHYETTGPEIWEDTDGQIDIFVAAFGTGGTVSGIGKYLKEKNPEIKVIGVEPASSPLITEGKAGPHKIQGIGANFIPQVLNVDVMDEVVTVTDDDALDTMKALAHTEGVLVGVSSGAAVYAAGQIAARKENEGKRIVVILPDTGERYLSIF